MQGSRDTVCFSYFHGTVTVDSQYSLLYPLVVIYHMYVFLYIFQIQQACLEQRHRQHQHLELQVLEVAQPQPLEEEQQALDCLEPAITKEAYFPNQQLSSLQVMNV